MNAFMLTFGRPIVSQLSLDTFLLLVNSTFQTLCTVSDVSNLGMELVGISWHLFIVVRLTIITRNVSKT